MYPQGKRRYVSSDLKQHSAFLEEQKVFLQPRSRLREDHFLTSYSARYMPRAYVARVRYGAAFQVRKTEPAWSWLHVLSMPITGDLRSASGGCQCIARPQEFMLRPPASEQVFDTADQTDELFLAVDPDYLRTFCARLLGKPLPSEIAFQANMPADSPQGPCTWPHDGRGPFGPAPQF